MRRKSLGLISLFVIMVLFGGYSVVGLGSSDPVYKTGLEFYGNPVEEGQVSQHIVTKQSLADVPNSIETWIWIDENWPLSKYPDGAVDDKNVGIIFSTWAGWEVDPNLSPREVSNNISISVMREGAPRYFWNNGDLTILLPETDFRTGEWIHFAIVRDETVRRGTVTFYMNGEIIYEWFMGGGESVFPVDPLIIGANYRATAGEPGTNWNGKIGEIRIWNIVRTQEEIQNFMNQELTGDEEGLLSYWKFDEGEGDVLHDSSPYGNHGTIVGAKWYSE